MNSLLIKWFNSGEKQISLSEDDFEIVLQRHACTLHLSVQLTRQAPDNSQLQTWIRLGGASLNRFHGALAQAPTNGALWLIQCLHADQGEQTLIDSLEALLNQRDTWRAVAARLSRPRKSVTPPMSR
ncbi:type III secretion protein [Pseudomonas sp. 58 R 12]|uniref:type III secretion protein n=1 Tax=Pseudomonas sp. 58 R 12 TaxID=1844107 RepID=UPI0009F2FCC4|nr:type III secretion protein [Pseudomonas sp. 58 R 12]